MARDLSFWKYEQENNSTHKEVYEECPKFENEKYINYVVER